MLWQQACLPNWPEFVAAFFASMKLGAIHVGVSTLFRAREMKFMLQNTGASTILVTEKFAGFNYLEVVREAQKDVPGLKNIIVVRGKPEEGMFSFDELIKAGKNKEYPKVEIDPVNDLATLIYTSGTTGFPKGAMHTHRSFCGFTSRFNKSLTIKYIYGIVSSKTMEGLCLVKAEDQN